MTMFENIEGGLWGCIVIFSAFFIQVLAFGTSQSIGVYNVEFLRYFDTGAAEVSLVGSINLGVFLGAGPIASQLMSRWSHRQVALLGAVLTNVGLLFMPFAPNLPYMYVFYGVLTGLGNCLVYVPSHILSGLYFHKHRSLATGIATAGSGLGASVFPIVMYHLIEYYGWKGSMFIISGLNMHLFIFAGLLRPVSKELKQSFAAIENLEKEKVASLNGKNNSDYAVVLQNENSALVETNNGKTNKQDKSEVKNEEAKEFNDENFTQIKNESSPMIDSNDVRLPTKLNRKKSVSEKVHKHFKSIFSFEFCLFWISNICWNAGGGILLIFFTEYMISEVGLDKETASLVFTFLGAGSVIGCVIGGLMGNIKYFDRVVLYILGNFVAGGVTLLVCWHVFHSFIGQLTVSIVFGFAFGIILGLLVVVTSDLIGTEGLGHGFGYLMFANGIGIFSGPPLAGILIDTLGHQDPAMYFSGFLTIMGGLVMCIVSIRRKWCSKQNRHQQQEMIVIVD